MNLKTFETFEDKRKQAMQTLVDLGVFKYAKDLEMFHGRAGDRTPWEVDPKFNNAGSLFGGSNIHEINTLYTSTEDVARAYAYNRAQTSDFTDISEVHKIVATDEDAVLANMNFNPAYLDPEDKELFNKSVETLLPFGITHGNPIIFEYKDALPIIMSKLSEFQAEKQIDVLNKEQLEEFTKGLKKIPQLNLIFNYPDDLKIVVNNLVYGSNSAKAIAKNPISAIDLFVENLELYYDTNNVFPIGSPYIFAWCKSNHIIGVEEEIFANPTCSYTDIYSLFNLKNIATPKQLDKMQAKKQRDFGGISAFLTNVVSPEYSEFLTKANSREVMDFINQAFPCKLLFDKSSGIVEGWSVGQHTQSVLEFMDGHYSQNIPDSIKPFMKIAILAHDFGKGYAKQKYMSQKRGTLEKVPVLYDTLEIPENYRGLINWIITDSQEFTSNIALNKGSKMENYQELKTSGSNAFENAFGKTPTSSELNALINVCCTLQTCDSGSYTRYASVANGNENIGGMNDHFTTSFSFNNRGDARLTDLEDFISSPQNDLLEQEEQSESATENQEPTIEDVFNFNF